MALITGPYQSYMATLLVGVVCVVVRGQPVLHYYMYLANGRVVHRIFQKRVHTVGPQDSFLSYNVHESSREINLWLCFRGGEKKDTMGIMTVCVNTFMWGKCKYTVPIKLKGSF